MENKKWGRVFKKDRTQIQQTLLDFDCRVSHYTIPAAKVVGNEGIVSAVDKEQQTLEYKG